MCEFMAKVRKNCAVRSTLVETVLFPSVDTVLMFGFLFLRLFHGMDILTNT